MLSSTATTPSALFLQRLQESCKTSRAVADAKPDYLLIIAVAATIVLLLAFGISLMF
jgi:hypothetical protein